MRFIDDSKCFECNSQTKIHQHHIIPKVIGGINTIPLCVVCHGKVHQRDFIKSTNLQKIGIAKAKERGVYKTNGGHRKKETIDDYIKKSYVKKICVLRNEDKYSLRKIAELSSTSLGTVQKCFKIISDEMCEQIAKHQKYNEEFNEIEVVITKKRIQKLEEQINNLKQNL